MRRCLYCGVAGYLTLVYVRPRWQKPMRAWSNTRRSSYLLGGRRTRRWSPQTLAAGERVFQVSLDAAIRFICTSQISFFLGLVTFHLHMLALLLFPSSSSPACCRSSSMFRLASVPLLSDSCHRHAPSACHSRACIHDPCSRCQGREQRKGSGWPKQMDTSQLKG